MMTEKHNPESKANNQGGEGDGTKLVVTPEEKFDRDQRKGEKPGPPSHQDINRHPENEDERTDDYPR